jgi:formate hydrogenlyase transcriptional activator
VKGAFTGAVTQTQGRFQTAHLGTLFLDEIGDLALELQPKLLRALQEQQFERLGSNQTCHVNVRIIAATNQDLWDMVQQRKFRADLYYRLSVFPITLPSLRERIADIPLLANHFMKEFAARHGKSIDRIPDEVTDAMVSREWPGNIRELQNWIERAVIMTKGSDLCLPGPGETLIGNQRPWGSRTLAEADRDHILAALQQARGVVGGANGAAARLGLPRTTLIARMEKLGIARRSTPDHFPGPQTSEADEHSRLSGSDDLADRSTWSAGQRPRTGGDDGFARYAVASYDT